MARRVQTLVTVASALTLVACSGIPVSEVRTTLSSAKPCCPGYESVQFATLQVGGRTKVTLTTSSPAMPTSEGLAYFAAYRVPQGSLRLELQALNTEYLPKSTYPDPLLILLDANYKQIAEIKDLPLVRSRHAILPGLFEYYYGTVVSVPANTHYVLVFARPNSDRLQSAVSDNGSYWSIPSAPVGTLALVPR